MRQVLLPLAWRGFLRKSSRGGIAEIAPKSAKAAKAAKAREDAAELEQIRAEAHHHRDRLALYRARALSSNPTSRSRLRELERISAAATERLARAERS